MVDISSVRGSTLIEFTFQRLNKWFVNRAAAANSGTRRNSLGWLPLLQKLHQIKNPRPRRRTAVQQFMMEYHAQVNAAFVSRHGLGKGFKNVERMNIRHDIAKGMLQGEYSHLINELEDRAKSEHEGDLNEWNLLLEDISLASDVEQYVFVFLFWTSFSYHLSQ